MEIRKAWPRPSPLGVYRCLKSEFKEINVQPEQEHVPEVESRQGGLLDEGHKGKPGPALG